jgi:flagellar biosynthesis/type III secretory pathway chaperone
MQAPSVEQLAHSLNRVLDDERDALVAGNVEPLATLAANKQALLQQLGPAFKALSAGQRRALAPLLQRAQNSNDFNAHLLAPRLLATRARTEALLHAGGQALYGADGAARQLATSRTSARA